MLSATSGVAVQTFDDPNEGSMLQRLLQQVQELGIA
jgi:hypothetical protein